MPDINGFFISDFNVQSKPALQNTDLFLVEKANAYYAYTLDEIKTALNIADQSSSVLVNVASPQYAISSNPNGHTEYGGPMQDAFNYYDYRVRWVAQENSTGKWIGQNFGSAKRIKKVSFRTGYGLQPYDSVRIPTGIRLESSADNSNWNSYGDWRIAANPYTDFSFDVPNPANHQYWRLFIYDGLNAASDISYIQMFA